jgi:hypothetical protein
MRKKSHAMRTQWVSFMLTRTSTLKIYFPDLFLTLRLLDERKGNNLRKNPYAVIGHLPTLVSLAGEEGYRPPRATVLVLASRPTTEPSTELGPYSLIHCLRVARNHMLPFSLSDETFPFVRPSSWSGTPQVASNIWTIHYICCSYSVNPEIP